MMISMRADANAETCRRDGISRIFESPNRRRRVETMSDAFVKRARPRVSG